MASFDYDVLILGSGFGGSVAALRAAEKGYRVGVMESGSRWPDEKIPKTQWDLAHLVCSTTSAPAPSGRARFRRPCSPASRSCASVTGPGSTSPPAPSSLAQRPRR